MMLGTNVNPHLYPTSHLGKLLYLDFIVFPFQTSLSQWGYIFSQPRVKIYSMWYLCGKKPTGLTEVLHGVEEREVVSSRARGVLTYSAYQEVPSVLNIDLLVKDRITGILEKQVVKTDRKQGAFGDKVAGTMTPGHCHWEYIWESFALDSDWEEGIQFIEPVPCVHALTAWAWEKGDYVQFYFHSILYTVGVSPEMRRGWHTG